MLCYYSYLVDAFVLGIALGQWINTTYKNINIDIFV